MKRFFKWLCWTSNRSTPTPRYSPHFLITGHVHRGSVTGRWSDGRNVDYKYQPHKDDGRTGPSA